MKKKYFIIGLCLASCLGLTGCGSSQEAVVTNLSNQIDLLNNTVNSINRNMSNIPNLSAAQEDKNINSVYQSAKTIMENQKTYKTAITTKNNMIKKAIVDRNLKLTDKDKKALIDLTSALSKNTRSLDESRSEMVRAATDVSKSYKDSNSSTMQISAKVNRLSNCMNSQSSYYKNLISTLNNIEGILNIDDSSFDYNNINELGENTENKEDNSKELQELLYQYLLNNLNNNSNCPNGDCNNPSNLNNNCPGGNCNNSSNFYNNCPNGNCNNNTSVPIPLNPENNGTCSNGDCPTNNVNSVATNQYINNGINGYNYNRPLINPSRNTDTYQTLNKNIDTYRPFIGGYNSPINESVSARPATTEESPQSLINVDDDTDIRRNNNPNMGKSTGHHRRKDTGFISNNQNDLIKKSNRRNIKTEENVKKINLDEKNKKQTFAGKASELDEISTLDINKNIEKLIKNNSKETFYNNNFLVLR